MGKPWGPVPLRARVIDLKTGLAGTVKLQRWDGEMVGVLMDVEVPGIVWLPVDELARMPGDMLYTDAHHPTGKCSCFGAGECWWCLWNEERERADRAEAKVRELLQRYVPEGMRDAQD